MNQEIIDLYKTVLDDTKLTTSEKRKLLDDIRSLIPGSQNRWNFRWVIWPLGLMALSLPILVLVQLLSPSAASIKIPDGLLSLASAAVGALAGFLAPNIQRTDLAPNAENPGLRATDENQVKNLA